MDNEIPLPPPPSRRTKSHHRHSRFDDRSSQQPSSDPALFSSDDIPGASGLENYHGENGRKRRYRGTWWGGETVATHSMESRSTAKRKRRDFGEKRFVPVDSGVWMGSDESFFLASEDFPVGEWGEELVRNVGSSTVGPSEKGEALPDPVLGMRRVPAKLRSQAVAQPRVERESPEHQLARAIVNDCLEKGQDSVDLSIGNMRTIPTGLLHPLQHLTKLPAVREPPVTEEVYTSLEPFLRLFLAGNALTKVSSELFELGSLKVLSVRNNKLTEIPSAIRKLTALQEVNFSVNRLRYLPWELLWLIKKGDLKHLIVRPNPLMQIEEADIVQWHYPTTNHNTPNETLRLLEYTGPPPEEAWAPIHIATSPIRRFNSDGVPIPDTDTIPTSEKTNVPTLRQASLLSLNKSNFFDLTPDTELTDLPDMMLRLLRYAREVRSVGGRCCSICHRGFVLPRTEWIEWWDCSTYENGLKGPRASKEGLRALPFLRVGCSWGCVPGGEQ